MPSSAPRLLVADDQPDILEALKLLLKSEGFDVETATSPRAVLAALDARDFVEKPWDNNRLLTTLRTQVDLGRAVRKSQRLENENRALRKEGLPEMIAGSPAMQPVLRLMERVGPSDANVLVLGEHGTGKEVVARWLHAASAR